MTISTSISVALCTFNGAKFLREQLQSYISQTVLPSEVVICDDRSTDGTWGILDDFRQSAPFPVRLIVNEQRLGPAQNFEKAIRLCRGDMIALSDQDDVWLPRKLQILTDALEMDPSAAYVFSDAEIIDEQGNPLGLGLWQVREFSPKGPSSDFAARQFELLLKSNVVTGCAMAFRTSFRDSFLPIPAHWIHDYWIAIIGSVIGRGSPVEERLFQYRRHASQQIGAGRTTIFNRFTDSFRARREDYWKTFAASQELQERVRGLSKTFAVPGKSLEQLDEKTRHLGTRAAIQAASGKTRLQMVLRESLSGRYQRFSGSWLSIVRDLCPPFLLN